MAQQKETEMTDTSIIQAGEIQPTALEANTRLLLEYQHPSVVVN